MREKKRAMTKAIVYFKDGNVRTFYSRDVNFRLGHVTMQLGINRLKRMILLWGDKTETAIIYNNYNGKEIAKFKEGKEVKPTNNNGKEDKPL